VNPSIFSTGGSETRKEVGTGRSDHVGTSDN
jgi:hypothetical protein